MIEEGKLLDLEADSKKKEFAELKIKVWRHLKDKEPDLATELIKNYLLDHYIIKSIRGDEKEELWIYNDGIYVPNGKSYVEEVCSEIMEAKYTTYFKNLIITKIKAKTYIDQEKFFDQQNNHPYLIPVQNGILDVYKKILTPFTEDIYFFNKLPVRYEPGQECPFIINFILEIVESEEDLLTIQEIFGFSLIKEYKYEKAFMLLGNGRNGKSKLIEIMKRFLGVENCANVSLQEIEKDGFSLCELHNKLVNISGDISKQALENTGTFKSLTGRDLIHAARKFKNKIKFENYAKMIFAANELPRTSDMSEAFFQRWVIINFPYTFYNCIDFELNSQDPLARKRNPEILQDILSDIEMTGLLNWAIEGLHRLKKNQEFTSTKSSEAMRKQWIMKSDSAISFVNDMIVDDFDQEISWSSLKRYYLDYCKVNNLKVAKDKHLKDTILHNTSATDVRKNTGIYYYNINISSAVVNKQLTL